MSPKHEEVAGERAVGRRRSRHGCQGWLALALLCGGIASCEPTQLAELKTPVLMWSQARNLCGETLAVDADRNVWLDHGCEDGGPNFNHVAVASDAQVDDLKTRLAALPSETPPPTVESCGGRIDTFSVVGGPLPSSVSACSTSAVYDDVTALPAAFQPIATAFHALE
jgi:hypothetical protein